MLSLSAKIRKDLGKKVKALRKKGIIPAILYGPEIHPFKSSGAGAKQFNRVKNLPLEVNSKEFEKILKEAGESSLVKLQVKDEDKKNKEFVVLIHEIENDPLTLKPIHIDFYQPRLKEEVEALVPLIFEGESKAVKELGGTLVKNISEVKVKALPLNLPKEIKVSIEKLKTFEDEIYISDLKLPEGVKILKGPNEIVAFAAPPEKVEEELAKPVEEKVEEVEKVVEKKEEKEEAEEEKK
jgi:large subunit ribosomal protein L25